MTGYITKFDRWAIHGLRKASAPAARVALGLVFVWFDVLKVVDMSPANPLVKNLLENTLTGVPFETFIVIFGWYEVLIGVCFLVPGIERIAVALLMPHMIMTLLPLAVLTDVTWQKFLIPTLEGQYIIKNVVIIALAIGIAAHLHPFKSKQ